MPLAGGRFPLAGLSLGSAALLGVAAFGGWATVRWRRERNRPINRLKRHANRLARDLIDWMADSRRLVDRLPDPEPSQTAGGVAAALLLAAVGATSLLRRQGRRAPLSTVGQGILEQVAAVGRNGRTAMGRTAVRHGAMDEVRTRWGRIRFPRRIAAAGELARGGGRVVDLAASGRQAIARTEVWPAVPMGIGGLLTAGAAAYLVWRVLGARGEHRSPIIVPGR